jgi:hypothetical protein
MLSIFETFNIFCNCFFPSRAKTRRKRELDEIDRQLASLKGKYDIHIIKTDEDLHLSNLYPIADQVDTWSIFVVGGDKTYIHACIGELDIPHAEDLLNRQGANILPTELQDVFDPFWNETLKGTQLQLYMSIKSILYLVNTYPFRNMKHEIIGAVMFLRKFVSQRNSFEVLEHSKETV